MFQVISCGLGGEWNGKAPICRYVDCGTPIRPDRGNINLVNGTTTVGSIVKYQVCSIIILTIITQYSKKLFSLVFLNIFSAIVTTG